MKADLTKRIIPFLYILFFILIFLNTSIALAYSITLSWSAPTKNADGTSITDLAGYIIHYGTQSRNYAYKIKVGNVTTYTVTNLVNGVTYYFAVTAYDKSGNKSEYSNEASTVRYSLKVNKSGTGKGPVTSSPAGINCGLDCKMEYKAGTIVTLRATPIEGSTFTGWSGGSCSGTGTCSITMNANKTVTANFNVTRPVTVTSPNGGEIVASGSTYTIQWNATTAAVKFKLLYSLDNGLTWTPIANKVTGTSYNWKVLNPWRNKKNTCLVRVIGYNDSNEWVGTDKSDAPFTIEVLKLTSPNEGISPLTSGATHTITWITNGTKNPVAEVNLYYTKDGRATWNLIKTITGNPGSFGWTVPMVEKTKDKCKVRIVLQDASGNILGADKSNGYFTIQP